MPPLQEVSHNRVAIPSIPPPYRPPKPLKPKPTGRPKGSKTTSESLRSAIIALHGYNNTTFAAIEAKTGVQERTASAIVQHAKEASNNSHNTNELLENGSAGKGGKHPMIIEGSAASIELREAMVSKEEMYKPWPQVAKDHGYSMARSTIAKIAQEHRDSEHNYRIKWAVQSLKPPLNDTDKRRRVEFCEWAIKELNNEAIFIFSDETYHEIGGRPRKKQKFSRPQGISSHQYAGSVPSVQFTIMH